MANIARYSQRQTEWKDVQLGTSDKTIGGYGCTITCLGMVADLNPLEVNSLFNKHGVYAQGNLVIWEKVNSAIPWLHYEKDGRKRTYDNVVAKDAITRHGFVLAEVNAAPIGSPNGKHWVVMIGGGRIVDPWDGKEKGTSIYTFTGLSIFHSDGKPQPTPPVEVPGVIYKGYDLTKVSQAKMKEWIDVEGLLRQGQLISKDEANSLTQTHLETLKSKLRNKMISAKDKVGSQLNSIFNELTTDW